MILSDGIALLCAVLALAGVWYRRTRERHDPLARLARGGLLDAAILVTVVGTLLALWVSLAATRTRRLPASPVETRLAGPAPAFLSVEDAKRGLQRLRPLARPLPPPQPGDWRFIHHERAQTFAQYLASDPVTARGERNVVYIQSIGELSTSQRRILHLTARFLRSYFCRPVQALRLISLDEVPAGARRNRMGETIQLLTGYILEAILRPRLPRDAVCMLGLTASDLWPGRGWNFVFGEASLRERVGVWSLHRMGEPDASPLAFKIALLRTLKMAAHETGHMFSIEHCVLHQCLMNGSNSLPEADQQPITLCPECWAKLNWAAGCHPTKRMQELESFFAEVGLEGEAARFRAKREVLERR